MVKEPVLSATADPPWAEKPASSHELAYNVFWRGVPNG